MSILLYTILPLRRRRRPRTSIAALFLRFSRLGDLGTRQSRVNERCCNPTSDKGPYSCNDQASTESNLPPVIVSPPRYADILKARRAMIEMGSKPWPLFVSQSKAHKTQQNHTNDEGPHCCDDQTSPPEIVSPPRYADILKARRAMYEMGSKPIWPVFVSRSKAPKTQQKLPVIGNRPSLNLRLK